MDKWTVLIILGVLVLFYVFLIVRQKRQAKKNEEALNSFKVGDKVITHIGIYGKIKRIYNTTYGKVCVLEIGTLDKIEIEMDMRYIAGIDEKTSVPDEVKEEIKKPEDKQEEKVVEKVEESKVVKEEKSAEPKKTRKRKN